MSIDPSRFDAIEYLFDQQLQGKECFPRTISCPYSFFGELVIGVRETSTIDR